MTKSPSTSSNQRNFAIMLYQHEQDNIGHQYEDSWELVVKLLNRRDFRAEKSGKAFSPIRMIDGAKRAKNSVREIHMAVADIDTEGVKDRATGRVMSVTKRAPLLDDLRPSILGFTWVAHSSHWHEPQKDVIKYRIVFPLSRPCTPEEWSQVWEGLNTLLDGHCDIACKDVSRLYYLPSCPAESASDAFFESNEGTLLDPDMLLGLVRKNALPQTAILPESNLQGSAGVPGPQETPSEIERVRSMLAIIPADCNYPKWRDVIWSIASTGWKCAEDIARTWSQTAPQKFNDAEFRKVFQSFKLERGIGFGTLVHSAKQAGWVDSVGLGRTDNINSTSSGDILNGEVFAKLYKDKLLFVHETGDLLRFETGTGWIKAPPGDADRAGKEVVDYLRTSAAEHWKKAPDDGKTRRLLAHVDRSNSMQKIRAMIEMAKSEPGMTVQLHELDADPMLLGVENGVLDLRNRQLLLPSPGLRVTKRCPVEFDPEATAPTLDAFIQRITRSTPALKLFLQRWAGYVLTGQVGEQCFAFLYGLGRNGKTTFAELLRWLLGDYAVVLPTATLMVGKRDPGAASPDLMLLKGCRLALASELEEGARFAEAAMKAMTGGDTMLARNPYGQYVSWVPSHKLVIVGNHKPVITGSDHGIWRRVRLIPFEETIRDGECDEHLSEKLRAEGPGVLNWALDGLRSWEQQGLNPPPEVKAAVASYQADMDILGQWMIDHVTAVAGAVTPTAELYRAYTSWARDSGVRNPMTRHAFGRRLAERGISLAKGGPANNKCASGITLNREGQQAAIRNL
ncbi:phage/plasmid primase, P4 family [Vogesella indigofera]|uniref:phage/plasmid primase, P4 family n=1 Tax=Vogesella indigofera TaxID=45465 RepID=UPI00234EC110|nr:phage/plasmid primase, P4 family [Vogesella indigofera]MDC7710055.1 phage/plasmid primase, P4 family [Vogesella indigofera]